MTIATSITAMAAAVEDVPSQKPWDCILGFGLDRRASLRFGYIDVVCWTKSAATTDRFLLKLQELQEVLPARAVLPLRNMIWCLDASVHRTSRQPCRQCSGGGSIPERRSPSMNWPAVQFFGLGRSHILAG